MYVANCLKIFEELKSKHERCTYVHTYIINSQLTLLVIKQCKRNDTIIADQ